MVTRQSPRILAAAALAALVVGLSSCATPQTLQPYTPAEGVQADVQRQNAAADSNEVPLKIRNLMIVAQPGANSGFVSGMFVAPVDRDDELVRIQGRTFKADNSPAGEIAPIQANVKLPAGTAVRLTEGQTLQVTASELTPGLLAELTLTFADSKEQTLMVPVVDASKEDYQSYTPGAAPSATPTPTAAAPAAPAPAEGAPAEPAPTPAN